MSKYLEVIQGMHNILLQPSAATGIIARTKQVFAETV